MMDKSEAEPKLDPSIEKKLKGHRDSITSLSFSPTDNELASSSLDHSVMVWKINTHLRSIRFIGHTDAVMEVTYSPTGQVIASASRDRTVRLWIPNVMGSKGEIKGHTQTIRTLDFNKDGAKLITGSDDKTVKMWSVQRQKFISSYVGHTNWVRCVRYSSDNALIASCSDDKTTKLWDIDSGQCIKTWTEKKGTVVHLGWHPSGCYVAVALSNGTVKLYDTRTHSLLQHYTIHESSLNKISFHPNGNFLITCGKDNKMKILDLMEGHPIYTLMGHSTSITSVAFSTSGKRFASAGEEKEARNVYKKHSRIPRTDFSQLKLNTNESISCQNNCEGCSFCEFHASNVEVDNSLHYQEVQTPRSPPTAQPYVIPEVEPRGLVSSVYETLFSSTAIGSARPTTPGPAIQDQLNLTRNSLRNGNATQAQIGRSIQTIDNTAHADTQTHVESGPHIQTPRQLNQRSINDRSPCENASQLNNDSLSPSPIKPATVGNNSANNSLVGLISLKDNQYCYTDGIIEWVGKKRALDETLNRKTSTPVKVDTSVFKRRRVDESSGTDTCYCPNVLPTVNTIVEHLNALNDALYTVEGRLKRVEDKLGPLLS